MARSPSTERVAPVPESPAHQRLLDLVRSRRSLSVKKMSEYYPEWTKADRIYSHYVEPGEVDSQGKRLYPWARSIVVPMSYAIVQTQLSWEMAAFTQRVPIVPLDGLSPEDVKPAKVMEQVLQHEWSSDRMSLALYQWLLDRRRYGVGIVWINWARDATRQRVEVQRTLPLSFLGIELPIGTQWEWQDRIKYEGNRLEPIDPFRFYPDPRVSLADSHRGEFVGFRTQRHYHELLLLERDGQYANVKRLPKRPSQGGLTSQASTPMEPRSLDRSSVGLGDWMGQIGPNTVDFQEHGSVTLDVFVIRIVPKDYQLSDSSWPQKYVVVVGNEAIILRAQPFEFDHDELPACVMELSADRHQFSTPGVVNHLEDLQDYLSWLWNCHDAETEILTERGWIRFHELAYTDRVATVDRETRQFWYEKPANFFDYQYDGDLIHLKSSRMDVMVTPNHKMWVTPARWNANKFAFLEAHELDDEYRTWASLRSGRPQVKEGALVLDEILPKRDRGARLMYPRVEIPWRVLAPFLGYYVSEGSATHGQASGSYHVSIRQKKAAGVARIDALMLQFPMHVTRHVDRKGGVSWIVSDRRLYQWVVEQCGKLAEAKRIPPIAQEWSRTDLEAFVMAAMDGDGSWMRGHPGLGHYSSTSRALADGFQILALELGWNASLTVDYDRRDRLPIYRVNLSMRGSDLWITPRTVQRVPYTGHVYCVENSTHLIVTRRNGRIAIHGQSHAENVRRVLNNQYIVDPSLIEISDLLQPQPGLLARLRREAQGRPGSMEQALKQIPVLDVTKTHGQDMAAAIDLMQRVSAAPENLQGVMAKGEQTLGEQQMAVSAAQGRLRMEAQMGWLQGMVRATHQRVSNIQQFLSAERWVQIVGTYPMALGLSADTKFLRVGPDAVQGQFVYTQPDMVVRQDAPMLAAMREIFIAVAKEPELRQRFDLVKLFEPMAAMAGIKNLSDYVREMPAATGQTPIPGMPSFGMPGMGNGGTPPGQPTPQGPTTPMPKVMQDEDVMRQVERGNLVPMG